MQIEFLTKNLEIAGFEILKPYFSTILEILVQKLVEMLRIIQFSYENCGIFFTFVMKLTKTAFFPTDDVHL